MNKKTKDPFVDKNIGLDKVVGNEIECNKRVLQPTGKKYAEVIFLGDVHYGSPECNVKKFKKMLAYCLRKEVYVILMGDMLEAATKTSVAAGWAEQEHILQKQYEDMLEFLKPLAKKRLIIGSLSGNHERRIWISSGLDVGKLMCRELKIPYLGSACWNVLTVGKQKYSVYALHGRTAAQSDGTVLTTAKRLAAPFHADVYAMGHAHRCVDGISLTQHVDMFHKRVVQRKKFVIITGSYLDYGGYWKERGGEISKIGSPKVKFFSEQHKIHISW